MSRAPLRVIQCGLGPIGLMLTREIAQREDLEVVAAVDVAPELVGRDVGRLAGLSESGVVVSSDAAMVAGCIRADVCLLTTTSSFRTAAGHMRPFIAAGVPIVTSCEEAAYPWHTDPSTAATVDEWARAADVAVLATGINPGFLMDLLPIALSAPMARVDGVFIERIQDAARRRLPFQRKVGVGIQVGEFHRRVASGTLRHVGLTESMHMIGDAFGFDLSSTEDRIEPLIAESVCRSDDLEVPEGYVRGVIQRGVAYQRGEDRPCIEMRFVAGIGVTDAVDRVTLEGHPRIVSEIKGGVGGDIGTTSILLNAIHRVVEAGPGLRTMADMPCVRARARR